MITAPFDDHLLTTHNDLMTLITVAPKVHPDAHDALLMEVAELLEGMTELTEDERDEIFARVVDALPAEMQAV